jgi:hypothetical protein
MKLLLVLLVWILLTLLLSWLGNWVLGFAGAFLIVPLLRLPLGSSIILGFFAGFLSWMGFAWFMDHANLGQLSGMISSLLNVSSPIIILCLTGILGGVGVAIAGWVASKLFRPETSGKVV